MKFCTIFTYKIRHWQHSRNIWSILWCLCNTKVSLKYLSIIRKVSWSVIVLFTIGCSRIDIILVVLIDLFNLLILFESPTLRGSSKWEWCLSLFLSVLRFVCHYPWPNQLQFDKKSQLYYYNYCKHSNIYGVLIFTIFVNMGL